MKRKRLLYLNNKNSIKKVEKLEVNMILLQISFIYKELEKYDEYLVKYEDIAKKLLLNPIYTITQF